MGREHELVAGPVGREDSGVGEKVSNVANPSSSSIRSDSGETGIGLRSGGRTAASGSPNEKSSALDRDDVGEVGPDRDVDRERDGFHALIAQDDAVRQPAADEAVA